MKGKMKKELLEMLKSQMKGMMNEDKGEHMAGLNPEKVQKVTVTSDSKEGLEKGLNKAQEIMKAKMGEYSQGSEKLKKKNKKQ